MTNAGGRFQFVSEQDGLEVAAYAWPAPAEPKGIVQIAHGVAEHALRYARFARSLNAAGYSVFAHDHRGHGQSLFADGALGDAGEAGWGGLVSDIAQYTNIIMEAAPDLPLFLFGHSMGSFAAQHLLLDHSDKAAGVILSGSTDIGVLAAMIAAGGEAPSLAAYNAAFEPARTPFDWLSRDEREVDVYVADPLCGWEPPDAFAASMIAGAPHYADPAQLSVVRRDLPILFAAGDADPLNGKLALLNGLVEKYRAAGFVEVESIIYPGARHEILNETNRNAVTDDIIQWLHKHAPVS